MIICVCQSVSDREVRAAIRNGVTSLEQLQLELGVASGCGKCTNAVCEMLIQTRRCAQAPAFLNNINGLPAALCSITLYPPSMRALSWRIYWLCSRPKMRILRCVTLRAYVSSRAIAAAPHGNYPY